MALRGGQAAVQDRHVFETPDEPARRLRGQGDLRHQNDGAKTLVQQPFNQADVNFGFARTGHPVEQKRAETFMGPDRLDRCFLVVAQGQLGRRLDRVLGPDCLDFLAFDLPEKPLAYEGLNRAAGFDIRFLLQLVRVERPILSAVHPNRGTEDPGLFGCQPVSGDDRVEGRRVDRVMKLQVGFADQSGGFFDRRRKQGCQDHAQRRRVIAADPFGQIDQVGRQLDRRLVARGDRLEAGRV